MNEKTIWEFLIGKTGNPYGTAAIMGNLMAESSLNPLCATGLKKAGYNSVDQYVKDSDDGKHDFANDGVAFGLAQWCYHTRKELLLDFAKRYKKSVGSLDIQLVYLVWEMQNKYKTAWNAVVNAADIRNASDVVMLKYEKPANTGDAAKQKRAAYGQKFYDQFAEGETEMPETTGKKKVVATENVNIRTGNGKTYTKVGVLKKDASAEWLETKDGWYKIALWVSADYAKLEKA